jgi:hypothetical protein
MTHPGKTEFSSATVSDVKPRKVRRERLPPQASRFSAGTVIRLVLFAALAIAGAALGLRRHMTEKPVPMRVPVPAPAPTFDADAGEIPVPDLP